MKYNIIIPASYKEIEIIKKNIPFCRQHLIGADTIFIITSNKQFKYFRKSFLDRYNVQLLDENLMADGLSFKEVRNVMLGHGIDGGTGWYFQQFLKMAFAFTKYANDYYLIWDADTIPLNDINFFKEGHILYNPKKEHHEPYFKMIENLLAMNQFADYSFISEHMMIKTSIMKELIEKIKKKSDGKEWWSSIFKYYDKSDGKNFSEFETYGTYCLNTHSDLYQARQLMTFGSAGKLFGRLVTNKELKLLAYDFDTASFERGHLPFYPRKALCILQKIIIELRNL